MSIPARTSITAAIDQMLGGVTRANAYRTNIGARVYIGGERTVNADELPCCVLTPGAEVIASGGDPMGSVVVAYSITAFANRRAEEETFDRLEWETIDAMLSDVRQVMESAYACSVLTDARNITYIGADPIYAGADSEPCGVTVRYSIITRQD